MTRTTAELVEFYAISIPRIEMYLFPFIYMCPYLHRRKDFNWNWLWDECIIWHIYGLPFAGIRVQPRFSCCPSFFVFVCLSSFYVLCSMLPVSLDCSFIIARVSGFFILHCPFCSLRFMWDLYKRTYRIKYINTKRKEQQTIFECEIQQQKRNETMI